MENKVLKLLGALFEVLVPCPWQLLKREAGAGFPSVLVTKFSIGLSLCRAHSSWVQLQWGCLCMEGWAGLLHLPPELLSHQGNVSFM